MNKERLWNFLKEIPKGMVVTYKDCAEVLGNSKAARAVGKILHNNPDSENIPCYKVVSSKGGVSSNFAFGGSFAQEELLRQDGIVVKNGFVDLKKYHYKKIIETNRLILRRLVESDLEDLKAILQDEKTMYAYLHAFSDEEVMMWFNNQIRRYQEEDGFGLYAVCLKENMQFIGQCGLTYQNIPSGKVLEVGYLFNRNYWGFGYATEASKDLIDYAFNLGFREVYSIIKDDNYKSQNVALRNNLIKIGEFDKFYYGKTLRHYIYRIGQDV